MKRGHQQKCIDGDEYDVITAQHTVCGLNRAKIKRKMRRRLRHQLNKEF